MRRLGPLLWLLLGCQVATGPGDPVWGKQACAHCMMLLSDPRPSAQVQLEDGSHLYFDDIGCMAEWLGKDARATRGRWVRSVDGKGWSPAELVRYSAGHTTPMDYGILPANAGMSFEEAKRAAHQRSLAREEALR